LNGQNGLDNLKPAVVTETCENERRIAPKAHVLVVKPGFDPLEHSLIVKRDNFLSRLKLFPEFCLGSELLN
jgi:hypothetical protein